MSQQQGNLRSNRLRSLFHKVIHGEQFLKTPASVRLYIDAICDQPDPVQCVQKLSSSAKGFSTLQTALAADVSLSFLNSAGTQLLTYIQAPELAVICQGDFLRNLLLAITDPPMFWNALVKEQQSARLEDQALQCFSWLLLQLVSLSAKDAAPYYGVATEGVQRMLLESSQLSVRTLGQKIKHVMETITSPNQFEGDGPGGRHDNDFLDIRDIAMLPTPDEISSTEPPYLRRATEIDECPATGRFAMHIDNQFRLLREDMLRDLREGLQTSLGVKKGRRKGLSIEGLEVEGVVCQERQPWALRLQCKKDLPQFYNVNPDARKKYVTDHRNFVKHQSLACLIANGEVTALVTIVRDEDLLAHSPPIICLQLSGREESIVKALRAVKQAQHVRLIQLSTAMFAYEPVLKQLQETKELTLMDEIMLWDPKDEVRATPISTQKSIDDLVTKLRHNPSLELKQALDLPKSTQLDASQAKCLLGGLTQRLSLVQGPPGTGKSFIGALIAKAIYLFSEEIILVVCYTNHALDQFLEDLLNVGIPADRIVRLGSFSKASTRTQPLVLSNQQGVFRPGKSHFDVVDMRKLERADDATQLQDAFTGYEAKAVSKSELMAYLEFDLDSLVQPEAFLLPKDTGGMIKVGRRGKAVDEHYLLDRWARGQDAGIYKNQAESRFPEVWQMDQTERQAEIEKWKSNILKERVSKVVDCGKQYNKTVAHLESLISEKDRCKLKEKRIIGCTTTAAAKYVQDIHSVSPGVVLVEEAGEILESHVLTALGPKTEQLILIGDHQQLRPKTHHDLSVEKGEGYDLNRSMFERLFLKRYPHQLLLQQHRMRPEISSLVRHLTYPNLTDAPTTQSRPDLRGFQDNLIFLDHEHPEDEILDVAELRDENSTSSKRNDFEARMTLRCVRYLAQQGYGTKQIVVLTPYVAQLRLLFDVLAEENDPVLNDLDSFELIQAGLMPAATAQVDKQQIRISTVDNYQGEESDIVVVSLTRCNPRGDIGFLSSPERLNVLLSRARDAMILIGNAKTFLDSRRGKDLWGKFFNLLKDGSHIYDGFPVKCERHPDRKSQLRCPEDFDECPSGGCSEPCNVTLKCGLHLCPQRCHQLVDHSKMPCERPIKCNCPNGHIQNYRCRSGKPASCTKCEKEKRDLEKKLLDDQRRQEKRDKELREHADKIAKIDEEIRSLQEAATDKQRSQEMAQALEQKKQDLEDAKRLQQARVQRSLAALKTKPIAPDGPPASTAEQDALDKKTVDDNEPSTEPQVIAEVKPSVSEAEWTRQKNMENASDSSIDALMKMTGLEEVKAQFLTIKAKTEIAIRQSKDMKKERFGIVLLGNPGTGKTTVARLYAKFLTSMGVLTGSEFVETTGARLASDGVPGAKAHIDAILKAGGGAFFLDEAYQLALEHNHGGAAVLDFLLAEIENRVGTIVFIFAGYNKQMEKFFEHNQGLESRMPYRLQFADYKDGELLQMLGRKVQKDFNGTMKVEGGLAGLYARIVIRRLGRGRGREGFGNARALENVLAKILERQSQRIQDERKTGSRPDDLLLKKQDLIGPEPSKAVTDSAAWKELQSLIGLKCVKDSMQGLVDLIFLNYKRELEEKEPVEVSLNRVFTGSPGTGKTSVAKLFGQVLADMGILSNGEVVVKNPADFVGDVLGATEKNTKAILKATEGKVLVIDEAYMLYSGGPGRGNTSDSFKTAVIDTIVAEVQSTLGEDRCVLLLGYKEKMEEMFQNSNPGLARRFRIEDAFHFDDFDDDQLRKILELKLKKQGLLATKEAKDVAIAMLARARHRPNFGNAGEVENMISTAKMSYQARQSARPLSERPTDVIFEPQDFDAKYDRAANASVNCRELFKDVLGCEGIVDKLEGYVSTANSLNARGIDPRKHIPFNFIFKGPPGTGKTTTARKMGQVFYDMGFLSTVDVHECSATELVGSYVGHTGPKVIALLEKALGKVLFVDEAYRLGEGSFATEAVNELVDSLTKPKFAGKIIVVLAGYEGNMNDLLAVNPGLSSRFSEEVLFTNMKPGDCWKFLRRNLEDTGISVDDTDKIALSEVLRLFKELSEIPDWGNGRDVETITKSITRSVFRAEASSTAPLGISLEGICRFLDDFLTERSKRSTARSQPSERRRLADLPMQTASGRPDATRTSHSTNNKSDQAPPEPVPPPKATEPTPQPTEERDPGVTDAVWNQLQADKAAAKSAQEQRERALAAAADAERQAAENAAAAAKEAERLAAQKARDDEERRRQEEARRKFLEAQRAREEAERLLRRRREEAEKKRKEEERVQTKLRSMGVCVAGFRWIKQAGGYRCEAGAHFISDSQLRP